MFGVGGCRISASLLLFGPEPLNFDQKPWEGRLTFVELKSGARV